MGASNLGCCRTDNLKITLMDGRKKVVRVSYSMKMVLLLSCHATGGESIFPENESVKEATAVNCNGIMFGEGYSVKDHKIYVKTVWLAPLVLRSCESW